MRLVLVNAPRAKPGFSYTYPGFYGPTPFHIGEVKTSRTLNEFPQVGSPGSPGKALTGRQRQLYPLIQLPGSGAVWYKPTSINGQTLIQINAAVPVDFFELTITNSQSGGGRPLGG
jgi:hypothetical protein